MHPAALNSLFKNHVLVLSFIWFLLSARQRAILKARDESHILSSSSAASLSATCIETSLQAIPLQISGGLGVANLFGALEPVCMRE